MPTRTELSRDVPTFVDFAANSEQVLGRVAWVRDVSGLVAQHLQADVDHYAKYRWVADYLLNYIENESSFKIYKGVEIENAIRLLRGS